MMRKFESIKYGMVYIGLMAAACYWFIESGLHGFIFQKTGVLSQLIPCDIHEFWMRGLTILIIMFFGVYAHIVTSRLRLLHEKALIVQKQLNEALTKVLSGFIPICAYCKKIRLQGANPREQNSWQEIELYLKKVTDANFSHGICPDCGKKLYEDRSR